MPEPDLLDPDIIATIIQIESCGNPAARSTAGAQGLFQVMPFHFEETNVNKLTNPAFDPIAKIPEFKVCAVKLEKV